MNDQLYQHVYSNLQYQHDEVLEKFVEALKAEYKKSLLGVVFYGSCMRTREYKDAMLDFYVIVDEYSHAYNSRWYSIANRVLPPNVFYLQVKISGQHYHSKYAVISMPGLYSAVNESFHPYFWARFTQPLSLVYFADENLKSRVTEIQCTAATTFVNAVKDCIKEEFSSEALWVKGLQLTYSAELRTETKQRASVIYNSQSEFYDGITAAIFSQKRDYISTDKRRLLSTIKWKTRAFAGKILSVLRLMKATTTFTNGVDYIAWKIERHTGEPVIVSDRLRKHPLIFCWPLLLKFYKQGKIR